MKPNNMPSFNSYFTGLGIDVSEHHIRLSQMTRFNAVQKMHEISLAEGLILDDKVEKLEEIKTLVADTIKKLGWEKERFATTLLIPESRVFSTSLLLPNTLSTMERQSQARELAQKDIPVPFDKAAVTVSSGKKEGKELRVGVYAVESTILEPLRAIFDPNIFSLVAIETNSKSLFRLYQRFGKKTEKKRAKGLIGIMDLGHAWATISVYTQAGSTLFSRSLSYRTSQSDKAEALSSGVVDILVGTLKEMMIYFHNQQLEIAQFVFTGFEAQDENLMKTVREQLNAESEKETVEKKKEPEKKEKEETKKEVVQEEKKEAIEVYAIGDIVKIGSLSKKEIHTFGAAIGAALRSVHIRKYRKQHNFLTGLLIK